MVKYAVLVIDLFKGPIVKDSPLAKLKDPGLDKLRERLMRMVPNVKKLLDVARAQKIPVIFAVHTLKRVGNGYDDGGLLERMEKFYKLRPGSFPAEVYLEGTKWVEPLDELDPQSSDYIIRKNRFSAFYGGGIEQLLRALKVDTLIITGMVTQSCVRMTAVDAFCRGWKCVVPIECVETKDDETQKSGLRDLSITCDLMSLEEVLKLLKAA
jgi:nicotinamidase-related amidase